MEFIILIFIYALIIIWGIGSFIRAIISTFSNKDNNCKTKVIIPIKGHEEKIEFIIRSEINKLKWDNRLYDLEIVCLDCGMDSETKKICRLMCKDYDFLHIRELNTLQQK